MVLKTLATNGPSSVGSTRWSLTSPPTFAADRAPKDCGEGKYCRTKAQSFFRPI